MPLDPSDEYDEFAAGILFDPPPKQEEKPLDPPGPQTPTGQTPENYRKATRRCRNCVGTGKVMQPVACTQCKGKWDGDRMSCQFCDRGTTDVLVDCKECEGKGRVKRDKKKRLLTVKVEKPKTHAKRSDQYEPKDAPPEPLYVRCKPCAEDPDRACAFCTDGYIPTGYDEGRLDREVTRADKYLILLAEAVELLKKTFSGPVPLIKTIEKELNVPTTGGQGTRSGTVLEAARSRSGKKR